MIIGLWFRTFMIVEALIFRSDDATSDLSDGGIETLQRGSKREQGSYPTQQLTLANCSGG
jgi:hypothetical protein